MNAKYLVFSAVLSIIVMISATALALNGEDNEDNSMAPRYWVHSDNPGLRNAFGAKHEFSGEFSAELTEGEANALNTLGIKTEPVQLYEILAKPASKPSGSCAPGQQIPWGVRMVNGGSGGANVTVAVLDTGAKKDHPDLAANVVGCKDATKIGIVDGCSDGNGHGTHVAGTILANGGPKGLGIYGVAPEAKLMAIKVCGSGGFCWSDDISEGIRYAADAGANIISMSLGSNAPDSIILSAVDYATARGVLVVAAAGNDGPADGSIDYPGAYYKVVAVGAIDSSKQVPSWSSRGLNSKTTPYVVDEKDVEFGAPGVNVESTWKNGCYNTISGTSMATPHVSGLAAKLWQGSANATRAYLHNVSRDIWTTGDDSATGFGLPVAP